jgi:small GTP-binding protein
MDLQLEVKRRIRKCGETQSNRLDLSDCALTEIPVEVFSLTQLTELKLGSWLGDPQFRNKIKTIPLAINQLQDLEVLILSGNSSIVLPDVLEELKNLTSLYLRNVNLAELPQVVTRLKNLAVLDLRRNRLRNLPDQLPRLSNLSLLNLSENPLTSLPGIVTQLETLQELYVSAIGLTKLPESIGRLKSLRKAELSNNKLHELPESIGQLARLEHLNISNNRLSTLPGSIAKLLELKLLTADNNPLEAPPIEIARRGVYAVQQYFQEIQKRVDAPIYEAKLLLIGEGRVGKTSLSKALRTTDSILENGQSTQGIDIQSWIIPKEETGLLRDFHLNVWDFGGQAIYHQTHQFFLTKRSLYLLVTESRKEDKHEDFYYWLNIIRLLGGNSPAILVLNKCDQPTKALPVNEYQAAFENLVEFHQVSCHPDYKSTLVPLREAIRRIITNPKLMPHVGSKLPGVWVQIREEIAKLREAGQDFISRDDYLALCARHEMNEERADFLSDYFHDIGVFLHFKDDPTLCETVILNHEWVTAGVYHVLDSQRVIDQKGRFSDSDLVHIWRDEKYKYKRNELRSLMMNRKFELIYELPSGGYLAPQMLPVDEITYEWRSQEANLRFEYRYKFMPKGILTRFIVKRHKDIYQETHWRYGVLLNWEDTRALVGERYFERKITIQLEGSNQRGFLDIIRKTIDEIHSSFNNLEVQQMIPCHCDECADSISPHFFDYAILRRFLQKHKATITCEKSVEEVDIRTLLSETVLVERDDRDIYYHIEGDYIGGDKVGNDKIQATIEGSENIVVGKRSRIKNGG